MAGKSIRGISGVLGELISPADSPKVTSNPSQETLGSQARADPTDGKGRERQPGRRYARVGRPRASDVQHPGPKEKVTLRLGTDLIAEYRDWSWEARCQLGELVETALRAYRRKHR